MTIRRYSSSAMPAAGMVFLIFLVMQALVANDIKAPPPGEESWTIFRPDIAPPPEPDHRTELPERIDVIPPPANPVAFPTDRTPTKRLPGEKYIPGPAPAFGLPGIPDREGAFPHMDGEMIPHFKVPPLYPQRERMRGIEGDVLVEFTVTRDGTVEGCKVIEDPSAGGLGRASCAAALNFEYTPRTINGEGVDVVGVQHMFTFKLNDKN